MERKIDYVIKQYIELFPFEKQNMLKIWSDLKYFENEENNYLDLLHIKSLSKSQLTKLCRKYNQKVSGNKPELIKRLKKRFRALLSCLCYICRCFYRGPK